MIFAIWYFISEENKLICYGTFSDCKISSFLLVKKLLFLHSPQKHLMLMEAFLQR